MFIFCCCVVVVLCRCGVVSLWCCVFWCDTLCGVMSICVKCWFRCLWCSVYLTLKCLDVEVSSCGCVVMWFGCYVVVLLCGLVVMWLRQYVVVSSYYVSNGVA